MTTGAASTPSKQMKLVFLAITTILLSIGVHAQQPDAAAAVRSFYQFHFSRPDIFDRREIRARRQWFTDDLNRLFQTELRREKEHSKTNPSDKPYFGDGLPFQPLDECVSDGKSFRNTYAVGAATIRDKRATVEVKFSLPKECGGELIDAYKVELINSKGKWLIDDWLYSDAKTLTADLKRREY